MSSILVFAAYSVLSTQIPGLPTGAPPDPAAEETPTRAAPASAGPCGSPRAAVVQWLSNLQPDRFAPAQAAQCARGPAGFSLKDTETAVIRLKRVLDARGYFVRVDQLPEEPTHTDRNTGRHEVVVTAMLPQLTLIRANDRWVLSPSALAAADELYKATFPVDLEVLVEDLPAWTRRAVFGVAPWQLGALFLLLVAGWLARIVVGSFIASQLRRLMARLEVKWGEELMRSASTPMGTLVFAGVFALGIPALNLGVEAAALLRIAATTTAAMSLVALFYRAVDLLAEYLRARADKTDTKLDDQLVPLVRRGLKVLTVSVGAVFVLQNLDVDVASLIAGLGLGGLAFALAAKDTIGHIFGSVTIFLDKPFQIGDWVVTCGVEGVVEEVGFRSTRIRTFHNSVVSVPNGSFTDAVVDNYGLRKYRRCSTTLSITYDSTPEQIEAFCDAIRGIIAAHPATWKDFYEVHFTGYGDHGLQVMLYFFFDVDSWSKEIRARHEVYLDVWRAAEALDVRFAFPTQTLHLETVATPRDREAPVARATEELSGLVDSFGPGGDRVVPPGPRVHPGFFAGSDLARRGRDSESAEG